MKCPRCTHQNPSAVKFCGNCGQRIGKLCSVCKTANLPESNFCHQCGKPLPNDNGPISKEKIPTRLLPNTAETTSHQSAVGERKYVTVLFSDLSGYTALSQRLDPEETKEIIARILRDMTKVIAEYEGFVEKYVGDALMAVFRSCQSPGRSMNRNFHHFDGK